MTCKPGFPDEGEDQISVEIKVIKAERLGGGVQEEGELAARASAGLLCSQGFPGGSDVLRPGVLPVIFACKVSSVAQTE